MIKSDLFEPVDSHQRTLKQVNALANVVHSISCKGMITEAHEIAVLSLLCDLSADCIDTGENISKSLTELYIVNDSVNGSSD